MGWKPITELYNFVDVSAKERVEIHSQESQKVTKTSHVQENGRVTWADIVTHGAPPATQYENNKNIITNGKSRLEVI